MNAFNNARLVEAKGLAIIRPFLDEMANGRLIMLDKGPLARALQQTTGDCIFQCPKGRAWSVEIKTEQEHTGNLFLESWSNRNLENPDDQALLGSNPGWMLKLRCDLLMYYFLDTDDLYIMDFFKLRQWAFKDWHIARFRERPQGKREQANDAWGWCVPVKIVSEELGPRYFRVLNPLKLATELPFPEREAGLPVHGCHVDNKAGHGMRPAPEPLQQPAGSEYDAARAAYKKRPGGFWG